ncbi:MAG: hypothetical protein IJ379_05075 [Lachnospiraceae bacterium]|nr:hypothetical protein [Lachnospiraceae bacterium]
MKYTLSKDKSWKNKHVILLLTGLMIFTLSGCEMPDKLFTDAGTDVVQQVDVSQYLDLSLLDKPKQEAQSWNGYEVYTLEKGTFETAIVGLRGNLNMVEISPVKAEYDNGSMRLLELCISRNSYVEEGEVIAKVSMETSSLDLEEQQIKLQRLEEELAEYQEDYTKRHEEAVANISLWPYPAKIDKLEIAQMELDHEQTLLNYEKQLADYRERIAELENVSSITEILAPKTGYVLSVSRLEQGQVLKNGEVLCNMAPLDMLVIEFDDETEHYGYGMDLQIKINDARVAPIDAEVVTPLGKVLYGNWGGKVSKLSGDYDIAGLLGRGSITVTGTTNVMKNVLLIPIEAVTVEKEKCYVTVLHEDGSLEKKQFISGGKNNLYYWVYDGLTEGTRIVVKD